MSIANFKRYQKFWLMGLAGLLLVGLGWWAGWQLPWRPAGPATAAAEPVIVRSNEKNLKLISPILFLQESAALRSFQPLNDKLTAAIDTAKKNHQIKDASVYFRDLGTGQWLGVNEDEKYAPASLYKVPLMITVLKEIENNPALLTKDIILNIKEAERVAPSEDAAPKIEMGQAYKVEELLKRMIVYSDNDSLVMLNFIISPQTQQGIFDELSLPMPEQGDTSDLVSPKEVSRFFRVLYNASYLSRNTSEFALDLLSRASFNGGLAAGVPSTVTVAHKYGRHLPTAVTGRELHDCGLIYHPTKPYFLCVMTKGDQEENLTAMIKQISQTVYEAVEQNKNN